MVRSHVLLFWIRPPVPHPGKILFPAAVTEDAAKAGWGYRSSPTRIRMLRCRGLAVDSSHEISRLAVAVDVASAVAFPEPHHRGVDADVLADLASGASHTDGRDELGPAVGGCPVVLLRNYLGRRDHPPLPLHLAQDREGAKAQKEHTTASCLVRTELTWRGAVAPQALTSAEACPVIRAASVGDDGAGVRLDRSARSRERPLLDRDRDWGWGWGWGWVSVLVLWLGVFHLRR